MEKKVNFAIIGCGSIVKKHIEAISLNEDARLLAVCDVKRERAISTASLGKCSYYTKLEDILNDPLIDVVSICTPNNMHAEMVIKALEAGKHVLCEKPMALCVADADKIVEVNLRSGRSFFLVKQNRFNPPIVALKNAFNKELLGKVYLINSTVYWNRNENYYKNSDWRGKKSSEGGALFTQASHFLDLMLYLGGKVKSVFAVMENFAHSGIETEDTGIIVIRFIKGAIGTLQYTTAVYESNFEGTISVFGTKGTIKVGGKYLNELEFWNVEGVPKPQIEQCNPQNDYGTYQGTMSNHDKVYKNITEVLLHNGKIATTSLEGRNSVEVMQAAYISSIKRREVFLPLKGSEYEFNITKC
ncbi:MAG: Gfo/Idh/MocA family oxidoreductase [Candidatus Woesearchaeota archaeon]